MERVIHALVSHRILRPSPTHSHAPNTRERHSLKLSPRYLIRPMIHLGRNFEILNVIYINGKICSP